MSYICNSKNGCVAQLDIASDYGSGGWGFDSSRAHLVFKEKFIRISLFFILFLFKTSEMSLEISNLTKQFGAQTALSDVNININKNEIIGLLGPNGAGKSTLMKSIVGALKIDHGQILFNGKDITANDIESKKNIGFLPENNPLYNDMFIKEYLNLVSEIHNVQSSKIDDVIEKVGLTPEISKKIGQLSKGYKQRVGLAQAILHEPDLLILDEPTNGLDPNQIIEIRNVIKEIGQQKTVILSTHIMQEVEALCSRVILINQGRIIQDSPIAEFLDKFKTLEEAFQYYTRATV